MLVEVFAVVHRHAVVGGKQILQHFDDLSGPPVLVKGQVSVPGSNGAAAGLAHMNFSVESGPCDQLYGCGGSCLRQTHFDAPQPQFVSTNDARAVSATYTAQQTVWLSLRFGAAAYAADRDHRCCDRQRGFRCTAAGPRNFKRAGEECRFDAGERANLHVDSGDGTCAASHRNFGNLRQERLADGQLVHARSPNANWC
jgi:hypothetical protein